MGSGTVINSNYRLQQRDLYIDFNSELNHKTRDAECNKALPFDVHENGNSVPERLLLVQNRLEPNVVHL